MFLCGTLYICQGCLMEPTVSIQLFQGHPVYLLGLFSGCYSCNTIILGTPCIFLGLFSGCYSCNTITLRTPCIFVRVVQWILQFQSNYSRDTLYICQGCLMDATGSIQLFQGHPVYLLGLFSGCYSFNPIIGGCTFTLMQAHIIWIGGFYKESLYKQIF